MPGKAGKWSGALLPQPEVTDSWGHTGQGGSGFTIHCCRVWNLLGSTVATCFSSWIFESVWVVYLIWGTWCLGLWVQPVLGLQVLLEFSNLTCLVGRWSQVPQGCAITSEMCVGQFWVLLVFSHTSICDPLLVVPCSSEQRVRAEYAGEPVQGHSDLKATDLWNKSVMSAEQLPHPSPTLHPAIPPSARLWESCRKA